ncbi:MAG: 6-bladed beta-propeller [Longimicrobiales bacterium]
MSSRGDANYQFEALSAAWKASDGRIIVADRGQTSILFYAADGRFLKRVARQGEGPGELRRMGSAFPYRGDSIAVFDLAMRRMSIFDGEGRFSRSFANPVTYARRPGVIPSQSCCQIRGAFADGSFVVHPPDDIPNRPGPPRYGMLSLIRLSPDGEQTDTIGTFTSVRYEYDASFPSDVREYRTVLPFLYAVAADAVIGSNAADNVVVVASADGERLDTVRLGSPPPPFTDAMIEERERLLREDHTRRPQFYEGGLESSLGGTYPELAPAFSQIEIDTQGRIWVGEWTVPFSAYQADTAGRRYSVFTRNGEALGAIMIPPGSRLAWAGEREVILIERDSLDVQYIRVYGIESGH